MSVGSLKNRFTLAAQNLVDRVTRPVSDFCFYHGEGLFMTGCAAFAVGSSAAAYHFLNPDPALSISALATGIGGGLGGIVLWKRHVELALALTVVFGSVMFLPLIKEDKAAIEIQQLQEQAARACIDPAVSYTNPVTGTTMALTSVTNSVDPVSKELLHRPVFMITQNRDGLLKGTKGDVETVVQSNARPGFFDGKNQMLGCKPLNQITLGAGSR